MIFSFSADSVGNEMPQKRNYFTMGKTKKTCPRAFARKLSTPVNTPVACVARERPRRAPFRAAVRSVHQPAVKSVTELKTKESRIIASRDDHAELVQTTIISK